MTFLRFTACRQGQAASTDLSRTRQESLRLPSPRALLKWRTPCSDRRLTTFLGLAAYRQGQAASTDRSRPHQESLGLPLLRAPR